MPEIRKLFIKEHFIKIGYIDGMKWIRLSTGKEVPQQIIDYFIESGNLKAIGRKDETKDMPI